MTVVHELVRRLRQPEYIGENRCPPCTAVNIFVAVALSLILGFVSLPLMFGSFVLFIGLIYFRGYLIPGTPALTRRYFPDPVLRLFDKSPPVSTERGERGPYSGWPNGWIEDGHIDPERLFCDMGVLTECEGEDEDDLCLTVDFQEAWQERIEQLRGAEEQEILSAVLDRPVSPKQHSVEATDLAFVVEYDGGKGFYHGRWESRAAFVADMAADQVLQARTELWNNAEIDRVRLVGGLRLFLEQCPECGGSVTTREEVVESCCRSQSVLATGCEECSARLFEFDLATLA